MRARPSLRRLGAALLPLLGACAMATAPTGPAPLAPGAALAAGLDSIFADTLFAGAHWGVLVRSLETDETLYSHNAARLFVPASNLKLVTGAGALEALGPDYRWRTAVAASGPVVGGELRGDLVVLGSGDPAVSARFGGGDARTVFRAWADSLRARGVTRIAGRVVGNDDAFDDVPLGRGWAWDDADASYSAEISALELNEGFVVVQVARGTAPGAPAVVTLDPPTGYVPVTNRVVTGRAGTAPRVEVARAAAGPGVVVSGQVPADSGVVRTEVAVRNNTAYFAAVLRETLLEAGIPVGGAAVDADEAGPAPAALDTLFVHASPALPEVLAAFLKPSQNQIGELLLKTLGRERRGLGTAAAGAAVVDSMQRLWGLPRRQLAQADGSGLSRYNLVSPALLVALLEHMRAGAHAAVFRAALPVAGVDGTLEGRMRGTPLQGNVHAKTGTLSGVRALSGYLTTAAGEPMVFSMIVNHHTLTSRDADRLAEAALLRVYALPRARR
ncbi:MAG TPA: D-alanyl-D-alanine carboxypeptidase/D-alanyl-D-alanine-endopeptidase [Longimicrobiaceae bacterium]|nr:D-alanyl-D-alanine carboxypeptidase/D-alanyl-D-alanine-endopeptidase [Longimicrobiaceae bacterium]